MQKIEEQQKLELSEPAAYVDSAEPEGGETPTRDTPTRANPTRV